MVALLPDSPGDQLLFFELAQSVDSVARAELATRIMSNPFVPVPATFEHFIRPSTLTDLQRTKLAQHLFNLVGPKSCEFCGKSSWAIGQNLVSPLPLAMDHIRRTYTVDHNVVHASVHLVCTVCGNTKLLHLAQLGFDPFAPENQ